MAAKPGQANHSAMRDERSGSIVSDKDAVFFHATPDPDACKHDFQGWRDTHDDEGRACGGEQVCTKCGIGAMTYSVRTGF